MVVPPSSIAVTVTDANPFASAAGVNVNAPAPSMAGCTENNPLLSLDTLKLTVWPASSAGPGEIAVAHPAAVCAPASSNTI